MVGKFITIEGGDGAGKSTQVKLLSDKLTNLGIENIVTREPGGTAGAEEIRQLLVSGEPNRWDKITELLLFIAARRDHFLNKIQPNLQNDVWVICDRFTHSTIAYQGHGHQIDIELINYLNNLAIGNFAPDITFLLDINVKTGLNQSMHQSVEDLSVLSEQRFENYGGDFHQRVRQSFLDMAKIDKRIIVIEASQSRQAIHAAIIDHIIENFHINAC
ncbi:MAG: dTMP kinase [Pseudomonadota bacterium]